MPQENYSEPAAYTLDIIGRTVKYVILGATGMALTAFLAFEGCHLYIENVMMASPSRAADGDEYAWADENQTWTGGEKGGTDPRLGWKARHALRGAWICWEWGAGDGGAIGTSHWNHAVRGGMIGAASPNRIDRGYELAEEYINNAITAAQTKGITFPPELPHLRDSPPKTTGAKADTTALDLLMLKAGVLERIATPDSLAYSRDLYERVLNATEGGSPVRDARLIRLAHKIGDLAQRAGDGAEADKWWSWGLLRAGITLPGLSPPAENKSWWSRASSPAPPTAPPVGTLAPPVLRAVTSILISASAAEAHKGTKASLAEAANLQALATSLLPPPARLSNAGPGDGPASLQRAWSQSRGALLDLYAGSVAHAQKDKTSKPLDLTTQAAERSEAILSTLTPILPTAFTSPSSNPCNQPAKRLLRDTLMTGAESYFTQAALLERSAKASAEKGDGPEEVSRLEHAGECYERAMSLAAAEDGQTKQARDMGDEDAVGRSEDWRRYWRGYVRVRARIMQTVEAAQDGQSASASAGATAK